MQKKKVKEAKKETKAKREVGVKRICREKSEMNGGDRGRNER